MYYHTTKICFKALFIVTGVDFQCLYYTIDALIVMNHTNALDVESCKMLSYSVLYLSHVLYQLLMSAVEYFPPQEQTCHFVNKKKYDMLYRSSKGEIQIYSSTRQ